MLVSGVPDVARLAACIFILLHPVAFAAAEGPWALGLARFVQGASSTTTWAGALAWVAVSVPRGATGRVQAAGPSA